MSLNACFLDLLPVELLHTIFTHFLAHEILLIFSDVSDHVDVVLLSYWSYRVNLKSILKCHFDLICHRIRPDQVLALTLSDDDETPGQSELFFSCFRIEQFTRLRSLKLINIELDSSLKSIFSNLNQCDQLRSFSLNSNNYRKKYPDWVYDYSDMSNRLDLLASETYLQLLPKCHRLNLHNGILLKTMSLPRLHHLTLAASTVDELQMIFAQTPQLTSLNVSLRGDVSSLEHLCSSPRLHRLTLKIANSQVSMNLLEHFLPNLSHLTHLELQAEGLNNLADGHRWAKLSHRLIVFNFKLKVRLVPNEEILNSFCTTFWVNEKRWYVAYDKGHLFSVPYFAPLHTDIFDSSPVHCTTADNTMFYEHITTLTITTFSIDNYRRYCHVENLEIKCDVLARASVLSRLSGRQALAVPLIDVPLFRSYLSAMPRLHKLSIDAYLLADFVEKLRGNQIEQIRTLEILNRFNTSRYVIEELLRLFPRVEHLRVSSLVTRQDIIRMLDGFEHLSKASFTLHSKFCESERDWFFKPELSIWGVRRLAKDTFTCRYHRSSANSTSVDIHIWIGKQIRQSFWTAHWPLRRGYVWYRFMHIMSRYRVLDISAYLCYRGFGITIGSQLAVLISAYITRGIDASEAVDMWVLIILLIYNTWSICILEASIEMTPCKYMLAISASMGTALIFGNGYRSIIDCLKRIPKLLLGL